MSAAEPAPPRIGAAIVLLALASFGSGASMRVNDALLPRLGEAFGVGLGPAAQVISLFAVAYGLAQLFYGPVGERYGKLHVIAGGTLACALASAACAAAADFDLLRLARIAAGATAAVIIPQSMAWIGDVVPYERRQPVLARFLVGQIGGTAAGVWLGGFAADHLHWRTPYVLLALFFAAAGIGLALLARGEARPARGASSAGLAGLAADFVLVLRKPWARTVLVLVFLEGLLLFGPFAFVAAHLHQRFGLSLSAAGSLVMLFGLGGLAYAMGARRLVGSLGEVGLAKGGALAMCGALLLLAFAPAWSYALPATLALGLGFYMMHNTLQINATQMAPERRGTAVAAFASALFLGQSAGVALAGAFVDGAGSSRLLAAGGLGLLAVGLAFGRALARRGSRGAAEQSAGAPGR